jgi:hypothetical protein
MPYKTKYFPKNPTKYIGDPSKILCRSLWERRFCKFLDENCHILKWSFETLKIPYISPKDNDIHIYYPDFIVEKKNKDGKVVIDKDLFEGSTINTPSMLCVEDYLDALQWSDTIGGLKGLIKRSESNLNILQKFVNNN